MENKSFSYSYLAVRNREVENIRKKYMPCEESKLERLKKLDARVRGAGMIEGLCVGVIGALILGFGMSLFMTDLEKILGSYREMSMVIGIVVGIIGGVIASLAYPMYNAIVKAKRKKIAPEIIRLTDELMK